MGIRTLLSRTASGVALPPVPAFEAAASTVRVPVTLTSALRHATADLRQRLARGRHTTGSAATGALGAEAAFPGPDGPTTAPALAAPEALAVLAALAGPEALSALTGVADPEALAVLAGLADTETLDALTGTDALALLAGVIGVDSTTAVADPDGVTGKAPAEAMPPCTPEPPPPGKPSRPWARLARDYLALALTLLPRPRPAHTTITVYIRTTGGALSERPGGSAPTRRQGQGQRQDRPGPEPGAVP
ncbi:MULTISPECIES: hypothetical protein [unclassified Streptomyces]|uniref:hypothetical protein n=1 Tax=unclassified Streptomyces TaxID=2593676 RepID=UPI0036E2CDCD